MLKEGSKGYFVMLNKSTKVCSSHVFSCRCGIRDSKSDVQERMLEDLARERHNHLHVLKITLAFPADDGGWKKNAEIPDERPLWTDYVNKQGCEGKEL